MASGIIRSHGTVGVERYAPTMYLGVRPAAQCRRSAIIWWSRPIPNITWRIPATPPLLNLNGKRNNYDDHASLYQSTAGKCSQKFRYGTFDRFPAFCRDTSRLGRDADAHQVDGAVPMTARKAKNGTDVISCHASVEGQEKLPSPIIAERTGDSFSDLWKSDLALLRVLTKCSNT